ncbi:hypothetical protein LPB137_00520 [Poseidonibacter parvus]|uniref:Uncharacterized protein n=1 Tax=Poseidonibacter parvus TaxID=1850254 RepID=A0A1P8KIP0_9BACT|nr:hypothetical protein [Poseidonibacter parvus]APW64419.1 hypothetical protein LPB137_00520 [Poseidonibacter parvus]
MNASRLIDRLMSYYNVHTISELSNILNIGQPAISKWKKNNSIKTIKNKLLELGIYDEIIKKEEIDLINEEVLSFFDLILDHTKYQLRDKIKSYTDGSFFDWANKMIPKKYLQNILKDISEEKSNFTVFNSKDELISRIKGIEVTLINKNNKVQLSNFIENSLSKIECYVLIQEHEEIMNYKGFWK